MDEIYPLYKKRIKAMSKVYSMKSKVPEEEFYSHLSEVLWVAVDNYDIDKSPSLDGWISKLLRNKATDLMRRGEKTHYRRFLLVLDKPYDRDNEDAPTLELSDEINIEDTVLRKKEADQRQLIDFLVNSDPSQVDPDTKLIVSRFPQYPSITALAKALGLHHEVVKRKLRRLARNYDANRFGDYRDYLIV
ncbi:hypothetical protein [Paenibacillus pinihumi]|uniref:hypothetical protein n=1 Tax=Paenibacillus pinihumi TaxID=669462 RepID=UPI0012B54E63|nr:hypothetical protein [Paenibacillus pinihumi]